MLPVGIHGGAELKSGFLRFMLVSDSFPAWNFNSVIDDFSKVVPIGRGG